jgi:hypothetical protein
MDQNPTDDNRPPIIDGWRTTSGTDWDRARRVFAQLEAVTADMVLVPTNDLRAMAKECLPNRNQAFPERLAYAASYRRAEREQSSGAEPSLT